MTADLAFLPAAELVARYGNKSLSPVEVTRGVLDRIAERQEDLNAYCLVDEEAAMTGARASEARWRKGRPLGLVDGVPTSVKDIVLAKGWPTLRGSRTIDPNQAWTDDGPCVARLREEGAVLLGKTATPEFAWKGVTDSPLTGITRNPWNHELTPGGSSGGAAAAVAAGLGQLAVGTDAGGSIRIPASFCGVFGFKPTFGRVPVYPLTPYATFASTGPITRTVEDAALMLTVMTKPDSRDWHALPFDGTDYRQGLSNGVERLRIAYSGTLGYARVAPEVARIVDDAVNVFETIGAVVEGVDPDFADPRSIRRDLWKGLTEIAFENMTEDKLSLMEPALAGEIRNCRNHPLQSYLTADLNRAALGGQMNRFHDDWDLLVTPSVAVPPFTVGARAPEGYDSIDTADWTPFAFPFNLTGQPAATVPCGFTSEGLPVGLQIVGRKFDDALVLRAARAFELARPWASSIPPEAERYSRAVTPSPSTAV